MGLVESKVREYYKDEYDLMDACKDLLIKRGYDVEHVPRRGGKRYKNVGVGKLDLICKKGKINFEIEFKNPQQKPHQWKIQGSQVNRFAILRDAEISHCLCNNINTFLNFIAEVDCNEKVYEYSGLRFI